MAKRTTREAVTNIEQPTAERLGQIEINVGQVQIICRALTFWERQYASVQGLAASGVDYGPDGEVLSEGDAAAGWIEESRAKIRLGIVSVTGMPVEWKPLLIGGTRREVISETTLAMFPDSVVERIGFEVNRATLLSQQERAKLDFFSQSAAPTGLSVTESGAEDATDTGNP